MLQTISIKVSGKVQGVFYRQSTVEKARSLAITGYVKNMPDDSVLIIATGEIELLDQLAAWCRTGPRNARVDKIIVEEISLKEFPKFNIER